MKTQSSRPIEEVHTLASRRARPSTATITSPPPRPRDDLDTFEAEARAFARSLNRQDSWRTR